MSDGQGINQQTAAEPSVKDLLSQIAAGGGVSSAPTKNYLGVPNTYRAKVTQTTGDPLDTEPGMRPHTTTVSIAPRYYDGDEWRPANLTPDKIAEVQRGLVDADLMSEKDYHDEMGSWGPRSVEAQARLLQNANATGQTADDSLTTLQAATAARGGPKADPEKVPEPLVIHYTNPDDIKGLANDVAVRRIGRRLSDAELEHHVAAWQASERTAAEQQYRMTGSGLPGGTGGSITDPVSANGLDEQIRREHEPDAQAYDAVGRFNQFEQLLKGA